MLIKKVMAATNDSVQLGKIGKGTSLIGADGEATAIYSNGKIVWTVLVGKVAQALFFVAAVASFIFLIWGGITLITSGGDTGKKTEARNRLTYAAIGLLVTALAFVLWRTILGVAGIETLNPGF